MNLKGTNIPRIKSPGRKFCVYFLRRSEELLYIGSTGGLSHRLAEHRYRKQIDFDNVGVIWCTDRESAYEMESQLIRECRPPMNFAVDRCSPLEPVLEETLLNILNPHSA